MFEGSYTNTVSSSFTLYSPHTHLRKKQQNGLTNLWKAVLELQRQDNHAHRWSLSSVKHHRILRVQIGNSHYRMPTQTSRTLLSYTVNLQPTARQQSDFERNISICSWVLSAQDRAKSIASTLYSQSRDSTRIILGL